PPPLSLLLLRSPFWSSNHFGLIYSSSNCLNHCAWSSTLPVSIPVSWPIAPVAAEVNVLPPVPVEDDDGVPSARAEDKCRLEGNLGEGLLCCCLGIGKRSWSSSISESVCSPKNACRLGSPLELLLLSVVPEILFGVRCPEANPSP